MKKIKVKSPIGLRLKGREIQWFKPNTVYTVDEVTASHPFLVERLESVEDIPQPKPKRTTRRKPVQKETDNEQSPVRDSVS